MTSRKLTAAEIDILSKQNCRAEDWNRINVHPDFDPSLVNSCLFSGDISIGKNTGANGVTCELYGSRIHNCRIGDHVRISNVSWLADYSVGDSAVLEAVGEISMSAESHFGNGCSLETLNEGGGRELVIFDELTSQIAYLQVMYRHNEAFTEKLQTVIKQHVESKASKTGLIADHTEIRHCSSIRDVKVGPYAKIRGAMRLKNGSVMSDEGNPVFIGDGVIADDFIVQEGSKIDSGVILDKCFVGQAVKLGKQFSAENSAFFANCEGFHGEACSVFAGPYTVSHHKSSLLIAGLYSFYNAGSGTNMSNHMYKLGPIHQSILERGSKTGSFSYILAPSRVGAFSVVIGKHFVNFDASEFPFSYITEEHGSSYLTPAMNLLTVGTRRDSEKWPKRDKRGETKRDLIRFDLYNPYIIDRVKRGYDILKDLYETTDKSKNTVLRKGLLIRRLMMKTSAKYYNLALKVYAAMNLANALEAGESINDLFMPVKKYVASDWVDILGMICRKDRVSHLENDIVEGKISTVIDLLQALDKIHAAYESDAKEHALAFIAEQLDKDPDHINEEDARMVLEEGAKAFVKLNKLIKEDAVKEFDPGAQIGYGIDGDAETVRADFEAVRGNKESNSFITGLEKESEIVTEKWKL
jgi:NDP-sugar pyrophosphorylase family protein